jgi:hypothetical protein
VIPRRGRPTQAVARGGLAALDRLTSAVSSSASPVGAGSSTAIRLSVMVTRPSAASRTSSEPISPKPILSALPSLACSGRIDSSSRSSPRLSMLMTVASRARAVTSARRRSRPHA